MTAAHTMHRLALALFLSGCATSSTGYRQAAATPIRAPLQASPPSFPRPAHTPPGAGASPLGQPWQAPGAAVERSPNQRVLPSMDEPGLWAADTMGAVERAGQDDIPAMIGGVTLPSPKAQSTAATRRCAETMNIALGMARLHGTMDALPPEVRSCVAARLFEYCAIRQTYSLRLKHLQAGVDASRTLEQREEAVGVAVGFAEAKCNDRTYPREANAPYNRAVDAWIKHTRMPRDDR